MPTINLNYVWYCRRCKRQLVRRGDILLCPNECIPAILPTDSEEAAQRFVISPQELEDDLEGMTRRAAGVERIAAAGVSEPPVSRGQ